MVSLDLVFSSPDGNTGGLEREDIAVGSWYTFFNGEAIEAAMALLLRCGGGGNDLVALFLNGVVPE